MRILDLILFILILILLGIAGGLTAQSANNVRKNIQYDASPELKSARSLLIWSSVLSFVGIAIAVTVLILYFIFGDRVNKGGRRYVILALAIFLFIIGIIAGSLAAAGAARMRRSANYGEAPTDRSAYNSAVAAAVMLLVGFVILFIAWILIFILWKPSRVAAVKEAAARVKETAESAATAVKEKAGQAASAISQKAGQAVDVISKEASEAADKLSREARQLRAGAEQLIGGPSPADYTQARIQENIRLGLQDEAARRAAPAAVTPIITPAAVVTPTPAAPVAVATPTAALEPIAKPAPPRPKTPPPARIEPPARMEPQARVAEGVPRRRPITISLSKTPPAS
jgi:uncharacterized membrane protein YidH (DUF202 family)